MLTYAGIGSRRAPDEILGLCSLVAHRLAQVGWVLRSGHAIGCDQAFEYGCMTAFEDVDPRITARAQIFLPWKDFESDPLPAGSVMPVPTLKAIQMVPKYHPAPQHLSMAAVRLHARNCHILLGPGLDDPVKRVICWTPDPLVGGTSMGLRIAADHGIPVHNLADDSTRARYAALPDGDVVL